MKLLISQLFNYFWDYVKMAVTLKKLTRCLLKLKVCTLITSRLPCFRSPVAMYRGKTDKIPSLSKYLWT